MIDKLQKLQNQAQWQQVITTIDETVNSMSVKREEYFDKNPYCLPFYQRACLEIGRGANFHCLIAVEELYNYQALIYYAFKGKIDEVKFILATAFKYADDEQQYWLAIATNVNSPQEAEQLFTQLLNSSDDETIVQWVKHRLKKPNCADLADASVSIEHLRVKKGVMTSDRITMPIISLICLNAIIFIIQIILTTTGGDTLFDSAALYLPSAIDNSQWWRFFSAGFIHFDRSHFLFNMLALFIFGKMTKPFTAWQIISIYFSSLLISNIIAGLTIYPYQHIVLAGASGAIFSLLGATTYYHFKKYNETSNAFHKKSFLIGFFVVAIQLLIDGASILEYQFYGGGQQSSLLGHLAGFVCGFYISALLLKISSLKKDKKTNNTV